MGFPENLLDKEDCGSEEMLILTNKSQTFGASSLFLPGVIDKIHACLGTGFYAIPASIHEFIIVSDSKDVTIEDLSNICEEANETIVAQKDILSDHVMYFPMK